MHNSRTNDEDEIRRHLDGLSFAYQQFCDAEDYKLPLGSEERQRMMNANSTRHMQEMRWLHDHGLIEGRDYDYDQEKRAYFLKKGGT